MLTQTLATWRGTQLLCPLIQLVVNYLGVESKVLPLPQGLRNKSVDAPYHELSVLLL